MVQLMRGLDVRRGKSDLILEGVLRVEKLLHEMGATAIVRRPLHLRAGRDTARHMLNEAQVASPPKDRRPSVYSQPAYFSGGSQIGESPSADAHHPQHQHQHIAYPPPTPVSEHNNHHPPEYAKNGHASLENAVLDSMHTSTTESVLQWPHFDVFPSLRNGYVSFFELEQSRPPIEMRPTSIIYPFVSDEEIYKTLESFQNNVNFWYPTMSRHQLDKIRVMVKCSNAGVAEDHSVESCLAHLTIALGYASQTVAGLIFGTPLADEDLKRRARRREMGDLYFDYALRKLHVAHMDVSSVATQCLFFTA